MALVPPQVKIVGESLSQHMEQLQSRHDRLATGIDACERETVTSIQQLGAILAHTSERINEKVRVRVSWMQLVSFHVWISWSSFLCCCVCVFSSLACISLLFYVFVIVYMYFLNIICFYRHSHVFSYHYLHVSPFTCICPSLYIFIIVYMHILNIICIYLPLRV